MSSNEEEQLDSHTWMPPIGAAAKVTQARIERQNLIVKLLGRYLLKGYKMLGDTCELCGTILLMDRAENLYCVTCMELDSDIDKDNPVLNAQAALSQARERQLAIQMPATSEEVDDDDVSIGQACSSIPLSKAEQNGGTSTHKREIPTSAGTTSVPAAPRVKKRPLAPPPPAGLSKPSPPPAGLSKPSPPPAGLSKPSTRSELLDAKDALVTKLSMATTMLRASSCIQTDVQLCHLIASCVDALRSLKEIGM